MINFVFVEGIIYHHIRKNTTGWLPSKQCNQQDQGLIMWRKEI